MNPIESAKEFVMKRVQLPALACTTLPVDAKSKVKSSNVWLSKFTRVGDLVHYLGRFDASQEDPLYQKLKEHGLLTFEDIGAEFNQTYAAWADDRLRPSDFIIGDKYGAHEILIFAKVYDTRSGGMFVIPGSSGQPSAVVIKATLRDGVYPNAWMEVGKRLKYFFKSIDGEFGDHFKTNAAILNNPGVPVLAFVRTDPKGPFTFNGAFSFVQAHKEEDGSKWFELLLSYPQPSGVLVERDFIETQLREKVDLSKLSPREARLERLKHAQRKPSRVVVVSSGFDRNADVIAEVLYLANGICGGCAKPAPFKRASDGSPYLEVHHDLPLAQGGEDTVDNARALCPNCHRGRHYGQKLLQKLKFPVA